MGTAFNGGFFGLPVGIKYTPDASRGLFHRLEFNLSFEAVSSISSDENRVTHFSDRLGLILRRPVYVGESFSVAIAPQASFFLRGDRGARLGLTGIAAYGFDLHSIVVNGTWTSATSPSESNPAQQYDVAVDYVRTLGDAGLKKQLSVFGGVLYQNPSHQSAAVSLGQGVSFRVRPYWVLDFAVNQSGLAHGLRDYQILMGFTMNLGRMSLW